MDTLNTPAEIAELKKLRQQNSWWRIGATALTVLWIGGCFISVNNSVQGLFNPGARQQQFVNTLQGNIQRDIVPQVEGIAKQTFTEAQPQVQASLLKLNDRVPELTQASFTELETLQTSLPAKGKTILDKTYGEMLSGKEAKIKEMFPEATEENIKTLTTNMTNIAEEKAVTVNDKLFAKHQDSLMGIMESMDTIRTTEPKGASAEGENWELALAVMDVVRDDMKDLAAMASDNDAKQTKTTASASLSGPKTANQSTKKTGAQ
ncbi:MAG: hypothetical protein H7Y38_02745 [Armatimonadetes bacterium]|nr:hypothetical protein [Armatimonadota bacterium]